MVVGHVQDGDAHLPQHSAQFGRQLVAAAAVQRAQRLVQHQQPGLGGQGPGQSHPLSFAPRQGGHGPGAETAQPHQLQHLVRPGPPGLGGNALHPQAEGHVGSHVAVGEQGVVLEHQPEVPPVDRHSG